MLHSFDISIPVPFGEPYSSPFHSICDDKTMSKTEHECHHCSPFLIVLSPFDWGHHSNLICIVPATLHPLCDSLIRLSYCSNICLQNIYSIFENASREKQSNWTSACVLLLIWTSVSNRLLDCLSRSIQNLLGSSYLIIELDESLAFPAFLQRPWHSNHIHMLDDCRKDVTAGFAFNLATDDS